MAEDGEVRKFLLADQLYTSLEERLTEQQLRSAGCALCRHLAGLGLLRYRASHHALAGVGKYVRGDASVAELAAARVRAKWAAGKAAENCGEAEYHAAEAVGYLTAVPGDLQELRGAVGWALDAMGHANRTEGVLDLLRAALPQSLVDEQEGDPTDT